MCLKLSLGNLDMPLFSLQCPFQNIVAVMTVSKKHNVHFNLSDCRLQHGRLPHSISQIHIEQLETSRHCVGYGD